MKMKNLFVSNLLLCATIVGACKSDNGGDEPDPLGPLPDGYYTIAVQPDDQQEVKGWGIYPGHVTGTHVSANNSINAATEARRVLFKELGITMYRVCLEPMCGRPLFLRYFSTSTTYSTNRSYSFIFSLGL